MYTHHYLLGQMEEVYMFDVLRLHRKVNTTHCMCDLAMAVVKPHPGMYRHVLQANFK